MPAIRAVLLDLGGPILDEDHEYAAWDAHLLTLLTRYNGGVDEQQYTRAVADATRRCHPQPRVSALWALLRPDLAGFRKLTEAFRSYASRPEKHLAATTVRQGTHKAIHALSERHTLALAANQPSAVRDILVREGLLEHFLWQHVSADMGVAKPDLLFFRMILDELGIPANEAVMVGDRLDADILPAKLLGLRTIRVLSGPYAQQEAPSQLHEPDITLETIANLPQAVVGLSS